MKDYKSLPKKRVGIVMLGNSISGGGGAERRFARLVPMLNKKYGYVWVYLIMSHELFQSFNQAGFDLKMNEGIIISDVDESVTSDKNILIRGISHIKVALKESKGLTRICKKYSISVLQFINYPSYYVPLLFFKPKSVALVLSVVTYTPMHEYSTFWNRLYRLVWHIRTDAIDSLYNRFLYTFKNFASKIIIAPCSFTDFSKYFPSSDKIKLILFTGRLEERKNPQFFLNIIFSIAPELRRLGWQGLILGGGELFGSLSNFIHEKKIGDIVQINTVDETANIINISSIYVSLQRNENYPSQSLIEAMSSGNAVVVSDVGETKRLVQPDRGILISEFTEGFYSQALLLLISNPELRMQLGTNARKYVMNHHTIERFADHMLEVWELGLLRRGIVHCPQNL